MSNTNNILTKYKAAPDGTGALEITRPCNLRGFWVCPGAAAAKVQLLNGTGGDVLFEFDVLESKTADAQPAIGLTLPGNGIRFDTGIWVTSATSSVVSITLFYQ